MPNHVSNLFEVKTELPKEKIDEIKEFLSGENGPIDFNKIIPMPDHVYKGDLPFTSAKQLYSETNWYGWCVKNWGTKWNAYKAKWLTDTVLYFETAWSSPVDLMKKFSMRFPDVEFFFKYADEDVGVNCGEYAFQNGIIIHEYLPAPKTEEAESYYFEIMGFDPEKC
jgi:hypothetical protein